MNLKAAHCITEDNISGGIEETGRQLFDCAVNANLGKHTQLHSVGDGASWIKRQVDEQFGENGTYLIDFMHLCEYLVVRCAQLYRRHRIMAR